MLGSAVALLLVCGSAGAASTSTHLDYWWSGSAFETDLLYAQTSQGLILADRNSKSILWSGSCEHRFLGDPGAGTALHCSATNGYVLGRIDDENPSSPSQDCSATLSYRPGYPMPMGAVRYSRKVMSIAATAPIAKGLGLVVHQDGNPFNSACESPTFSSPDSGKRYFISVLTGWGSGPRREHWTGSAQPGLGLARSTASFDGELDIGIWSGVPNRSVGEQILIAVKEMLAAWWTSLTNGFASSAPPKIFTPTAGTLDVTGTQGAQVFFSIHEALRPQGSTPLRVTLTSDGRAALADPARAGKPITLAMRLTPKPGEPASLKTTFATSLVPQIDSVQFSGKPADPTIAVRGLGLTPLPARSPSGSPAGHDGCPAQAGTYGSDYGALFNLNDLTKKWSAGLAIAGLHATSCIGLVPTKVSSGEVDFKLGSFYTALYPKFSLDPGDEVQLVLNGAVRAVHVKYGAPVSK